MNSTDAEHKCGVCPKSFTTKSNLNQHTKHVHGGEKPHRCGICSKPFSRKRNRDMHLRTCSKVVSSGDQKKKKDYQHVPELNFSPFKRGIGFSGIIAEWTLYYPSCYALVDPLLLIKKSVFSMRDIILEHNLAQTRKMKYTMSLHIVFAKAYDTEVKTEPPVVLTTPPGVVYLGTDIDKQLESSAEELVELIEQYEGNGSGWVIDQLVRLDTGLYSF